MLTLLHYASHHTYIKILMHQCILQDLKQAITFNLIFFLFLRIELKTKIMRGTCKSIEASKVSQCVKKVRVFQNLFLKNMKNSTNFDGIFAP